MMPHIGDTQVAWLLLLYTTAPRAQFALRTLAAGLTREFAVAHDAAVLDTLSALLCAEERSSLPPAASRVALHSWLCVTAALACVVPRCTRQLLFGRRGPTHSLFCPFGMHPSCKVWHELWMHATSRQALRFGTCLQPLTCSSLPASACPFGLTCPSMPLHSQPTTPNPRSPCVAGSALPLGPLMTLL